VLSPSCLSFNLTVSRAVFTALEDTEGPSTALFLP